MPHRIVSTSGTVWVDWVFSPLRTENDWLNTAMQIMAICIEDGISRCSLSIRQEGRIFWRITILRATGNMGVPAQRLWALRKLLVTKLAQAEFPDGKIQNLCAN